MGQTLIQIGTRFEMDDGFDKDFVAKIMPKIYRFGFALFCFSWTLHFGMVAIGKSSLSVGYLSAIVMGAYLSASLLKEKNYIVASVDCLLLH